MSRNRLLFATTALCAAIVAFAGSVPMGSAGAADKVSPAIAAAVASIDRRPPEIARDAARHPADIIAFAGIKPGDVVADFIPGDAYYTRILSKVVGSKGTVYAYVLNPGGDTQKVRDDDHPTPVDVAFQVADTTTFNNVKVIWSGVMGYGGDFPVPKQLDAVFTADGYHELKNSANGKIDTALATKAIYREIKSGGVYVVVDYASTPGQGSDTRSDADTVKADAKAAGFVLEGESKILANASDTHGALPADQSARDKADHFVLKFRKPANAPSTDQRPPVAKYKHFFGNSFVFYNVTTDANGKPTHWESVIYYWPDMTMQQVDYNGRIHNAAYFWDADGHNCELHEYPISQRGFIACHPFNDGHWNTKPDGKAWDEVLGNGTTLLRVGLMKGIVAPNPAPPSVSSLPPGVSDPGTPKRWETVRKVGDK